MAQVQKELDHVDCLHFHTDFIHFPMLRERFTPHVTTLHGRLDLPDLKAMFDEFSDMPVVSIADHQRAPLPMARWVGTVYNGIPADRYQFRAKPGNYLAFLGRMSPEKGAETAIQIALKADMPIKMAAKIDKVDQDDFDQRIRPYLDHPLVEYIGEIDLSIRRHGDDVAVNKERRDGNRQLVVSV